jgi:taurine transport system permease protein
VTLDTLIAATDEAVDDPLAPPARAPRAHARPDPARLATVATLLALLAGWWLASHLGLVSPVFLPTPEAVARQFVLVARDGFVDATLLQHLGASLGRVAVALLTAAITAIPVGLAIGLSPVARGIFDPLIEFYRPIPPLAYLSLIIIWFGIGEPAKIILITLAVFAPVAIATAAGVKGVPQDRINAARAMGAGRLQVVWLVVLPNALPEILTGLRIGLGIGWSTLVAAELVAATRGLGFMVQSAANFLVTDVVIMGILTIAAIALALELLLRLAERLLVPWKRHG